ncbi:hypothetical protein ABFS83_08G033700 [Erythranthe nasuta]
MESRNFFIFVFFLLFVFAAQKSMGDQCFHNLSTGCTDMEDCRQKCAKLGYPRGVCFVVGPEPPNLCTCECK